MSPRHERCIPFARWVLLLLFVLQFAVSFDPSKLAWDGTFYYAFTRSLILDGDLRLRNDLLLSYEVTPSAEFVDQQFENKLTPTGRVDNPFAIGTALLWAPWFAAIYGLARLAGSLGLYTGALTGYEPCFRWGIASVTCFYGWLAIDAGFRVARSVVSDWAALVASITTMFLGPLLYYQFREPFYAHIASALTASLFVAAWWKTASTGGGSVGDGLVLGTTSGLAALVRTQNTLYLILPALSGLTWGWAALRRRQWSGLRRTLGHSMAVGLGALLVMTLQLSVWQRFYGQWVAVPQGAGFVDWRAPWLGHVLFSPFHGLLPWMPVVLPAALGLVLLARRNPRLAAPLLAAFALQVYVNASVRDWFGAGGYGGRRFSNSLVILLVGYACLLDLRPSRLYRLVAVGVSGGLILHQWLLFRYGFPDRIGGRVVSMAPLYEWQADSTADFVRQLASYIPLALRHPLRTVLLPGSPLAIVRQSWPRFLTEFGLLLAVLVTWWLVRLGWRRLAKRFASGGVGRRFRFLLPIAAIAAANWWILVHA